MKERSLILSAWEVRAILAGTKTRITRPIVPQPEWDIDGEPYWHVGGFRVWQYRPVTDVLRKGGAPLASPFGESGDVLWCKETWAISDLMASMKDFPPPDGEQWWFYTGTATPDMATNVVYLADIPGRFRGAWRPSVHMPRWAARIALRVETESVGRVQDISAADAVAEGFVAEMLSAAEELEIMWDCIYAKRGLGYAVNPWCYSATFVRVAPRVEGSDRP